jgi:hypothetical protein
VFFIPDLFPTKVFSVPVVLELPDSNPINVLLFALVFSPAPLPTKVFSIPVEFRLPALLPIKVLSSPVYQ